LHGAIIKKNDFTRVRKEPSSFAKGGEFLGQILTAFAQHRELENDKYGDGA
jgi:hypothetical protein